MAAIDAIVSSKTKYKYLINIVKGILCQNLLLYIHPDIIDKMVGVVGVVMVGGGGGGGGGGGTHYVWRWSGGGGGVLMCEGDG